MTTATAPRLSEALTPPEPADPDTLTALYEAHYPTALRYAGRYAGRYQDAEDLVHEAFLRVSNAMTRRDAEIVSFTAYLRATIRHLAMARSQKLDRIQPTDDMATFDRVPAEHLPDDGFLVEAFRSLPERWRQVLWLRVAEQMPRREVAAQMGLTAAAAGMLYRRALDGLRAAYTEQLAANPQRPARRRAVTGR
jgi:RNA polymerase sigma factor (sigma-70 family)